MGTWQITRLAGEKSVTFKFHHTVKLASGETITVWSMDAQATHEPPLNIVMKTQKWPIADSMETVLYNNKNEVRISNFTYKNYFLVFILSS